MTEGKMIRNRQMNMLIMIAIIVGICIPLFFTAIQIGVFAEEPVVEARQEVTDESAPVLRVAVDDGFCPMSFYDADGNLSGLNVELITMVANQLGMRLEFECGDWMTCRQNLEEGKADAILGLETFSNMQHVLKTVPVTTDQLNIYGKNKIESLGALANKKVAVMARSVIMTMFDLQCEYVEYNTNSEILKAVENGEVDYGICHEAVAEKIIEKENLSVVPSLTIMNSFLTFGVWEDKEELRDQMNTILKYYANQGTLARLENKWIVNYSRNRSLSYVIEQNKVFYVAYLITWLFVMFLLSILKADYSRKQHYIATLLEYQSELEKSSQEVMRANQAKSDFLSHMTHDIRTPINGIMGMVEVIKKNCSDQNKVDECLDKIQKASGHLLDLLNDVLDMSKLESGKIQLEQIPFELEKEMKELQTIMETQAEEKGLTVFWDMTGICHNELIGSPLHMRRILLNLLSNAVKYNKKGGEIHLTVNEIMQNDKTAMFEFKVADNGIGMSESFIEDKLFQPFVQGTGEARTKYQGTGLGMSIVQRIVREMTGSIDVESKEGEGTTFTVTLPFAINRSENVPKTIEEQKPDISGMKILVVEDIDLNLEIAQFMLEEDKAVVEVARDGLQAVEAFKNSREGELEAILMDIMMPNMDGIEATKTIRSLDRADAKSIPIIAMTANAFVEDMRKTKEAGMNEHLTKPVDGEKLLQVLYKYKKTGL